MSNYQKLIDTEMGAPPVSTIDVDTIMARQDRRMRYQKIGAGGALAVMVAALALGYTMLPRARGPAHATQVPAAPKATAATAPTPAPAPTSSPTSTEDRLNAVLAELPQGLHVPKNAAFTLLSAVGVPDYYHVDWRYKGATYSINISDDVKPNPDINGCAPQYIGRNNEDCTQDVTDAGVTLQLLNPQHQTKFSALIAYFAAMDGTHVDVRVYAAGNRLMLPKSLMTPLVTAAQNPGFTLHP